MSTNLSVDGHHYNLQQTSATPQKAPEFNLVQCIGVNVFVFFYSVPPVVFVTVMHNFLKKRNLRVDKKATAK